MLAWALLFASRLSHAADPDTFDPAHRDPSLLAPAVKIAQAERRRIAERITDEFLDHCARFLREVRLQEDSVAARRWLSPRPPKGRDSGNRAASVDGPGALDDTRAEWNAASQASDLAGDKDVDLCMMGVERDYYEPRNRIYESEFRTLLSPNGHAEAGAYDAFEGERLTTFERQFGTALVERLEKHAPDFAGGLGAMASSSMIEPGADIRTRARAAILSVIRGVATEERLQRYARAEERLAPQPLSLEIRRRPTPSLFVAMRDRLWQDGLSARWAAAQRDAAAAEGLSATDFAYLEYLVRRYGDHPQLLAANANNPNGRELLDKEWKALRAAIGDDVADFFDAHSAPVVERVDDIAETAALSLSRSVPWHAEREEGPSLRVNFVPPARFDDSKPATVRLVGPHDAIVWTCSESLVDRGPPRSPCFDSRGWFAGAGSYRFEVLVEGKTQTAAFRLDGTEQRVEVVIDPNDAAAPYSPSVTRILPAPAGVRLESTEPAPGALRLFDLVNRGSRALFPADATWAASIRLERAGARRWYALPLAPSGKDAEPIASGGAKRMRVDEPRYLGWNPYGRRVAIRFRVGRQADGSVSEAAVTLDVKAPSVPEPAAVDPQTACLERPRTYVLNPHFFAGVVQTPDGVLATHDSELVRLAGGRTSLVLDAHEGLSRIRVSPDGRSLAVSGEKHLFLSEDGGASFATLSLLDGSPRALAFAGQMLFVFTGNGKAYRRPRGGQFSPVALPEVTGWEDASFSDERHGAVVGRCRRLLVTSDGGATWSPRLLTLSASHVLIQDHSIYVTGTGGLFRSDDNGLTFTPRIVATWCWSMAARDGVLAVACAPAGPGASPIFASHDGDTFAQVPAELPLRAGAVALGPGGALTAVGAGDVCLRGNLDGVAQVLDSRAARKSMLDLFRDTLPGGIFGREQSYRVSVDTP